ncbi:phosphodiester glycosidase family protein [Paenibacillus sp.]|uniref:phosphodiester glycosidase family protein n=1 Tax=Paenibacillus sp. TaxID=58172 RepID=UPI002812191A|nr:phosphodiester glycosidase family protein [Paenibacillus sp.]
MQLNLLQRRWSCAALAAAVLASALLPIAPASPAAAMDMPRTEFGQIVDMRRTELAPGAAYTWYDMSIPRGSEKLHFVEFDPTAPHLELQAGTKSGKVYGFQRLTEMADDADAPGNRVIAGINADFFDISGHATGVPNGLFVGDGTILNSASAPYAFGLKADGTAVYGSPVLTKTVTIDGVTTSLTHINRYRDTNQWVLYTDDYSTSTKTNATGDEVRLEILEGAVKSGQTMRLRAVEVRTGAGDTPLAPGFVVLSATGTARNALAGLEVGDEITASFALSGEWNDVTVAVGGQGPLIKDGVVQTNVGPEGVHPRTAIGTKADGTVVLFEIDGRAPGFSEGVETVELAKIMRDIGVVNAVNLDGGGSSTFIARLPGESTRKMLNRGSDGGERSTGNGLLLVNTAPEEAAAKLVVRPNYERVLAGSRLALSAAGVDATGHPAAAAEPVVWTVDPSLGTIDAAGVFTAGDNAGEGVISARAGSLSGEATVEVVETLTALKFPDAMKAFNVGDAATLSVTALRDGQVVQADNRLFEWRVEGPIGTIDGNGVFQATSENSKTGKIFVKHGNVETSMDVEVGTPPVVLEDFENGIGNYNAAGANFNTVRIFEETGEDFVRFGGKALRMEYDFVGKTGTSGIYLSAKSVDTRIQVPGYPEKISMWVYGDGKKHWLRAQMRDGNNAAFPIDFTSELGGVDWVGWKYLEAAVPAGKKLPLTMDLPVRYMETKNNNKTNGIIYIDQIRAVYGPLTEDRTPPIIKNAAPADRLTVNTATPTIRAVAEDAGYDPDTSPGTTLIDPAKIRLYVDGLPVAHSLYPPKGEISYIPNEPLEEGPHTVKLSVRDLSGNQTIEEWKFNVDLGSPKFKYETPATVYAGNAATLDIRGEKANLLTGGTLEFAFDPSKTASYEVVPGAKLTEANVTGVVSDGGVVRVSFDNLQSAALTDADMLAQIKYKVKPEAAGTNDIALRSGEVSFEGRATPMNFFAWPVVSEIGTQLLLSWNYEGIVEGYDTTFTVVDADGNPVAGASILADGIPAIGETNAEGKLTVSGLTAAVKTIKLLASQGERHSPVIDFKVSKLAGSPNPYNISVAMSEDPTTSRRLSWNTHPHTAGTVAEVAKASEFTDFDAANVITFAGSSGIYNTNNDGTIRVHKAVLDGLEPDTEYVYRVGDGAANVSASGKFRTAPIGGDRTKFLFFGDSQAGDQAGFQLWGNTVDKGVADASDAEFIVHAGDIVDLGHEEEQWNMWFAAAQEELMNTTLVAVVGNHEVTGEDEDNAGDEGKDFKSHFNFPDNGIEELKGTNYSFDYKNIHFAVLNSEYYFEEQRDWLREDLSNTDRTWKIVIFHRGPYGGYYSTEAVKRHWTPVFDEFGVDLVLNGHDHLYLKTHPMKGGAPVEPGEGTVYVVGGSSGPKFYELVEQPWQEKVYDRKIQIYSTIEVVGDTLTFVAKAVDTGEEIDRFTLTNDIERIELAGAPMLTAGETSSTVAEAVYGSGRRVPLLHGVTYGSSDPSVATIDASGVVRALAAGTTVISAAYGEWSDAYTLQVSAVPPTMTGISVDGPTRLFVGEEGASVTRATYDNGMHVPLTEGVFYGSSDPIVASIDTEGNVRALAAGTTVISAVYGEWSDSYALQVDSPSPAIDAVTIEGPTVLTVGDEGVAAAKAIYSDGVQVSLTTGVVYGSSEPNVATIDAAGKIRARAPGTTVISADYGEWSDDYVLEVKPAGSGPGDDDDSPPPSAPSTPTEPAAEGRIEIDASALTSGRPYKADGKLEELVLPGDAARAMTGEAFTVEAVNLTIAIPANVLQALSELLPAESRADSRIVLKAEPVGAEETARLLAGVDRPAGAAFRAAGELYAFELSIVAKDGESFALRAFETPIAISIPLRPNIDPTIVGMYYMADDGTIEYVGGTVENGVLTADIEHFSTYAALEYEVRYSDVPADHWAADVIRTLSAKHLVEGVGGATFAPERSVTRAEFAALLVRALGLKGEASVSFADVASNRWYADEIGLAAEAGIAGGAGDGTFRPEANVTRQEMAAMLVRAYAYAGGRRGSTPAVAGFEDTAEAPAWAQTAIREAFAAGLVQGRANGRFQPESALTRAESVQALENMLEALQ